MPGVLAIPVTFLLVCLSWVFFRAESLTAAGHYFAGLLGHYGAFAWPDWIQPRDALILALTPILIWGPMLWDRWIRRGRMGLAPSLSTPAADTPAPPARIEMLRLGLILGFLVLSLASLTTGHFNPFIYFQF